MKLKLYVLEDLESGLFHQPVFTRDEVQLNRGLLQARNNPESELNAQPDQFMIHYLGEFDDETGVFSHNDEVIEPDPIRLVSELQYKAPQKRLTPNEVEAVETRKQDLSLPPDQHEQFAQDINRKIRENM